LSQVVTSARILTLVERSRTTTSKLSPVEMCEAGFYGDALAMVADWKDCPEKLLVQGAALAVESPEAAKDLLSEAVRSLTGDQAHMGLIWLGCCYWATGEIDEARVTLDSVPSTSLKIAFALNLSRSIVESKNVDLALALLAKVEGSLESVNPLWRGKWLNQKAYLLRRTGALDRAIIAYEEARYWFEVAENPRAFAGATNNIAAIFSDLGDFAEAHRAVDLAIELNLRTGAKKYLADAYDHKARICLAENKSTEARQVISNAIRLMEGRDEKEALARALITEALSLSELHQHNEALRRLHRATQLAETVANNELLFDIAQARMRVAESLVDQCDVARIELALKMCKGSFRAAAKLLHFTHPRLSRLISKHKLPWKGNKPLRSIITRNK
jgi:tetratricopeptide (TPR) repeat protein